MFGRKTSYEVLSLSREEAGDAIVMAYLHTPDDVEDARQLRLLKKLRAYFDDMEVGDDYEIFIRRR